MKNKEEPKICNLDIANKDEFIDKSEVMRSGVGLVIGHNRSTQSYNYD